MSFSCLKLRILSHLISVFFLKYIESMSSYKMWYANIYYKINCVNLITETWSATNKLHRQILHSQLSTNTARVHLYICMGLYAEVCALILIIVILTLFLPANISSSGTHQITTLLNTLPSDLDTFSYLDLDPM